ncbi:hypothetical protein E2562_003826 [Oryza meyeriana var. granulata]|uniref:Jacalin-type lectin domain-containing protein n=1 Tax=Oryza meyeriana var. granulata TaxID=110450 RepID=A0A6G1BRP0_9ORYZ|nr:hypothetical protein E2562_003826 [Oryza meyeriana var. granulata]
MAERTGSGEWSVWPVVMDSRIQLGLMDYVMEISGETDALFVLSLKITTMKGTYGLYGIDQHAYKGGWKTFSFSVQGNQRITGFFVRTYDSLYTCAIGVYPTLLNSFG